MSTDFKNYRTKKTVNTIPYSSDLPQTPSEQVPMGHFNSKKVTVVGMGQVSVESFTYIVRVLKQ